MPRLRYSEEKEMSPQQQQPCACPQAEVFRKRWLNKAKSIVMVFHTGWIQVRVWCSIPAFRLLGLDLVNGCWCLACDLICDQTSILGFNKMDKFPKMNCTQVSTFIVWVSAVGKWAESPWSWAEPVACCLWDSVSQTGTGFLPTCWTYTPPLILTVVVVVVLQVATCSVCVPNFCMWTPTQRRGSITNTQSQARTKQSTPLAGTPAPCTAHTWHKARWTQDITGFWVLSLLTLP